MDKFAVNYNTLEDTMEPKQQVFRLSEVKHRLTKVAFGVVKFTDDDDVSGLWEVQQTDDGEYIVAMYDESSVSDTPQSKTSSWKALSYADNNNIQIFYKDEPVAKVALASMGISAEDAPSVARYLPSSLDSNKTLVAGLLGGLTAEERTALLVKYPELQD